MRTYLLVLATFLTSGQVWNGLEGSQIFSIDTPNGINGSWEEGTIYDDSPSLFELEQLPDLNPKLSKSTPVSSTSPAASVERARARLEPKPSSRNRGLEQTAKVIDDKATNFQRRYFFMDGIFQDSFPATGKSSFSYLTQQGQGVKYLLEWDLSFYKGKILPDNAEWNAWANKLQAGNGPLTAKSLHVIDASQAELDNFLNKLKDGGNLGSGKEHKTSFSSTVLTYSYEMDGKKKLMVVYANKGKQVSVEVDEKFQFQRFVVPEDVTDRIPIAVFTKADIAENGMQQGNKEYKLYAKIKAEFYTNEKISGKDEKVLRRSHIQEKNIINDAVLNLQFFDPTIGSSFTRKHVYEDRFLARPNKVNSYDDLIKPGEAMKYLLELDMSIKGGDILTLSNNPWTDWVKSRETNKFLTVIDDPLSDLVEDVFTSKEKEKRSMKEYIATTQREYDVTHMTYVVVDTAGNEMLNVYAERLKCKIPVVYDPLVGKIVHLEPVTNKPVDPTKTRTLVAQFTPADLQAISDARTKYQGQTEFAEAPRKCAIRRPTPGQVDDIINVLPSVCSRSGGGKRNRNAEAVCSITWKPSNGGPNEPEKPNPDKDKIIAQEFLTEYETASPEKQKKMLQYLKEYPGMIVGDAQSVEKIHRILQVESIREHVEFIQASTDLQHKRPLKYPEMASALDLLSSTQIKLSQSAMAQQLSWVSNSQFGQGFSSGVSGVSLPLGNYFLAKGLIDGIMNNDTTGLAIIGGRLGLEFTLEGTEMLFDGFKQTGQLAKLLGELAGPIGDLADIGLSVWSLTQNVERLKNATDKYDRIDIIADIVMDAVDLGITAAVTALSFAFPPAAPLIAAVGIALNLIAMAANFVLKAFTSVGRVNSQIPLHGFEKRNEFSKGLGRIFGIKKEDYMDNLLKEKQANDIAVQQNMAVLQKHPELAGIVFPARTMFYRGSCTLYRKRCSRKVFGICLSTSTTTLAHYCDWGKPCGGRTCSNYQSSYPKYECKCSGSSQTTFGEARAHNTVDFRSKKYVYLERSVPSNVNGASFKCKPGSLTNKGYQVSQSSSSSQYLCEDAIALYQTTYRANQTWFFNLEDGNDKVYVGSSSASNYFLIGDGNKWFEGGSGKDDFVMSGPCNSVSGLLDGKTGEDTLALTSDCWKGQSVTMNAKLGRLYRTSYSSNYMQFTSVEHLKGRVGVVEEVIVGCGTKSVDTGGGSSTSPDVVRVINDASCAYNVSIIASGRTSIYSDTTRGLVNIILTSTSSNSIFADIKLPSNPTAADTASVLFLGLPSQMASVSLRNISIGSERKLSAIITSSGNRYEFHLRLFTSAVFPSSVPGIVFRFQEPGDSISFLTIGTAPLEATIYHPLPALPGVTSTTVRRGRNDLVNLFDLLGGSWNVYGGSKDDEFSIFSHTVSGSLDGAGGSNVLRLRSDISPTTVVADLNTSYMFGNNLRIVNFPKIIGRSDKTDHITAACGTTYIEAGGGRSTSPDVVNVLGSCSSRLLSIIAAGNTKVIISSTVRLPSRVQVIILPPQSGKLSLNFVSTVLVNHGIGFNIQLKHSDWAQQLGTISNKVYRVKLASSGGGAIDLTLNYTAIGTPDYYLTSPNIVLFDSNSEPQGQIIIEKDTAAAKVLHNLYVYNSPTTKKIRRGLSGFPNMFQITNGTWEVYGGTKDDLFSINTEQLRNMLIDGGEGGQNTLVFDVNSSRNLIVNFMSGTASFSGISGTATVRNIQHILGRSSRRDTITVSCATRSVNGRGGGESSATFDLIQISSVSTCSHNVTIHVPANTTVMNNASRGIFSYVMDDVEKASISLVPTETNSHFIQFKQRPWEIIKTVAVDTEVNATIKLLSESGRLMTFQLAKIQNGEYQNPKFQFQVPGEFGCDLHVTEGGATYGIFKISSIPTGKNVTGLPVTVNHFVIDVASSTSSPRGSVIGPESATDSEFWIANLLTPLERLDGGGKNASVNRLQFLDYFYPGQNVTVDLVRGSVSVSKGQLTSQKAVTAIHNLINIHEVVGRTQGYDSIYPSCKTKSVNKFAKIIIENDPTCSDQTYDLIMGIGPDTTVKFDMNTEVDSLEGAFHYRFTQPVPVDIQGYENITVDHFFYLPFTINQLDILNFSTIDKTLTYSMVSDNSSQLVTVTHKMMSTLSPYHQFYTQPHMISADGYHIQNHIENLSGEVVSNLAPA